MKKENYIWIFILFLIIIFSFAFYMLNINKYTFETATPESIGINEIEDLDYCQLVFDNGNSNLMFFTFNRDKECENIKYRCDNEKYCHWTVNKDGLSCSNGIFSGCDTVYSARCYCIFPPVIEIKNPNDNCTLFKYINGSYELKGDYCPVITFEQKTLKIEYYLNNGEFTLKNTNIRKELYNLNISLIYSEGNENFYPSCTLSDNSYYSDCELIEVLK